MKIRYKNYSYGLYILIKEVKGKGNSFKKEFYERILSTETRLCPKVKGFPKSEKVKTKLEGQHIL